MFNLFCFIVNLVFKISPEKRSDYPGSYPD